MTDSVGTKIAITEEVTQVAVTNNNKSCTQEYGCSEIYDGDLINIEGYDSQFKASIYELDKPKYIPHI